ncbi:hypothetical protein GJR96_15660 [Haloferax sp. MBLA0076]|uniref:Uncharacterized protein n=1 Tax=Haloferax litoreum TaxID=2666140 RepID=A0A6A8GJF9_9EURY|nr:MULTISPECIES: hypothetical protein [Haloferax]KAB1190414.1 hypothetical protein Hfx1148_15590 [Haloferax sp. CBA1148]MRX23388.1 hypothetical protein [Haloferax litoreum]
MSALQSDEQDVTNQTTTVTTWTTNQSGLERFPHRLWFNVADFGRLLWWSMFAVVPAVLFAGVVFFDDGLIESYNLFCAGMMMFLVQMSERYINTTIEFEQDDGSIETTFHMGDPTLFRSDQEATVPLEDVEAAQFLSLARQPMVRLHYKKTFSVKPSSFLIPQDKESQFREFLQRHNVSVHGESETNSTHWVWGRFVVTALFIGVIPLCAMFVWPIQYSWAVLLVLTVTSFFLVRQGF